MLKFGKREKDCTVLEISNPMITTYTQHAHLLAILGRYPETYPWIYSNYIQLYINKNFYKHSWGDFYFPFPYEIRPSDTCKWLYSSKIRRNIYEGKSESLINFIREVLAENYYIHVMLNHKFLSRISNINNYHDLLIYGIDMNKQILYVSDFFGIGKYSNEKITFSEFYNSFDNYNMPVKEDYLDSMIYLYKVKDECDYQFNVGNIENSIQMYLENIVPEYWMMYNMDNKNEIVFGRQIYDVLANYIDQKKLHKDEYMDVRPFYMKLDHKRMMLLRFRYLNKIGCYKTYSFECNIREMEKIIQQNEIIVNLVVKYNVSKKIDILEKIKILLEEIKQLEFGVLKKYSENFLNINK